MTIFRRLFSATLLLGTLFGGLGATFGADQALDSPEIQRIQVVTNEIVITVNVPAGVSVVTLEGRVRFGRGVWIPRGVRRTDGSAGEVQFRLPNNDRFEVFRVKGEVGSKLPTSFFQGTKEFAGREGVDTVVAGATGATATATGTGTTFAIDTGMPTARETTEPEVVESDIWQIEGDRLYFFNQNRGLQIIDVTNPDAPSLTGSVTMPAAGEQMYVLPNQVVMLLAHDRCGWWGDDQDSQLVLVDASGAAPNVITNVPVSGRIQESRLVGSALYVAAQFYRLIETPNTDGSTYRRWEWGTRVSSFDLSDPTQPIARDELWFPGRDNVIHATSTRLFVAVRGVNYGDWWQSEIHTFDISSPDGSIVPGATIRPTGRVADKFKMDLQGNRFTVITEARFYGSVSTHLQNYNVTDISNPQTTGGLQLAHGERLFATRFDGNKAYIVTYLRIDPLWIVDLSDDWNPRILGELEVPGWSTYIQPHGNRLVTIGIDDQGGRRVSVSLFDVVDPANPALLSRVSLGEHYSWSEANNDEKAFGFLPDDGLILVPFQNRTTNGYSSRIQLIDFTDTNLIARGAIIGNTNSYNYSHRLRRSALHNRRILSLSGNHLLTVDASNRDHPRITSEIPLAWNVDRVILHGDHLLELEHGDEWNGNPGIIRVFTKDQPDRQLTNHTFAGERILGTTRRDDILYVATAPPTTYNSHPWIPFFPGPFVDTAPYAVTNAITLHSITLSELPALSRLHRVTTNIQAHYLNHFTPLWVSSNVLVWHTIGSGSYFHWGYDSLIALPGRVTPIGSGSRLLAFDTSSATNLAFLSDYMVPVTNYWGARSAACVANNKVYVSYESSLFKPGFLLPGRIAPPGTAIGTWIRRHLLQVVDYGDPAFPTPRQPINIPGTLVGLSHNGNVLYTQGQHWDSTTLQSDGNHWLDASAYDGVSASLLDSIPVDIYRGVLAQVDPAFGTVYLVRRAPSTNAVYQLQGWRLNSNGQLAQVGSSVQLDSTPYELRITSDILIANRHTDYTYINISGGTLGANGKSTIRGCIWPNFRAADGSASTGLWLPLGNYGVTTIPALVDPVP